MGADSYAGGLLGDVGSFLGFVSGFGGALWKNYQVLQEQIESIQGQGRLDKIGTRRVFGG